MSTTNETCKKELPQQSILITTVQPKSKSSNKTQKTKISLAPENLSAYYNSDYSKITINVTVYIDSSVDVKSLDIYEFQNALSNSPQKSFCIVYDYKEEIPKSLNSYSFSFEIPSDNKSIKTIETCLWNEDPEGSRGTETTVRPPVG